MGAVHQQPTTKHATFGQPTCRDSNVSLATAKVPCQSSFHRLPSRRSESACTAYTYTHSLPERDSHCHMNAGRHHLHEGCPVLRATLMHNQVCLCTIIPSSQLQNTGLTAPLTLHLRCTRPHLRCRRRISSNGVENFCKGLDTAAATDNVRLGDIHHGVLSSCRVRVRHSMPHREDPQRDCLQPALLQMAVGVLSHQQHPRPQCEPQ